MPPEGVDARLILDAIQGMRGGDEDANQAALLELLEKHARGEAIATPDRLANVIARNRRVDAHRKRQREASRGQPP